MRKSPRIEDVPYPLYMASFEDIAGTLREYRAYLGQFEAGINDIAFSSHKLDAEAAQKIALRCKDITDAIEPHIANVEAAISVATEPNLDQSATTKKKLLNIEDLVMSAEPGTNSPLFLRYDQLPQLLERLSFELQSQPTLADRAVDVMNEVSDLRSVHDKRLQDVSFLGDQIQAASLEQVTTTPDTRPLLKSLDGLEAPEPGATLLDDLSAPSPSDR